MIDIELRVETVGALWRISIGSVREDVPPLTDLDLMKAIDRVTPKKGDPITPDDARTWDGFLGYLEPGRGWSPGRSLLESVGRLLHEHLIRGKVATSLSNRIAGDGRPVRLTVNVFEGEEEGLLVRLPFELLVRGASFWLRTPNTACVRMPPESDPCDVTLGKRSSIVLAGAHLDDRAPSAKEVGDHLRVIQELLEDKEFECRPLPACTRGALEAELRKGCDALYVVAHGTEDFELLGRLHLRDGSVSGAELGQWLEEAQAATGKRVECVLLCSCSSAAPTERPGTLGMAAHLARGALRAKAALGFRAPVEVKWALGFMSMLFQQVSTGAPLEVAVARARAKQPESDPQWSLPCLYTYAKAGAAAGRGATRWGEGAPMMGARDTRVRSSLPAEPRSYFTGRDAELDRLRRWQDRPGTAVLRAMSGEGGVGKTELARALAYDVCKDTTVIWLDRPDRQVGSSLVTLMRKVDPAFEAPAAGVEDLRASVVDHYRGTRGLLVLDDVEDGDAVVTLTPGPGWNVLVTTRQRQLVPGVEDIEVGPLSVDEAVELLARVSRDEDDFPAAERRAGAALVEALGCLPLAIEVAGELVRRGHSLAEVRDGLRGELGQGILARVGRVIDRSLAQLLAGDEEAWAFVAAMPPAGATAEDLALGLGQPIGQASRRLFRLRQANLLRHYPQTDRYAMHSLARDVARARSQAKGRWDDMLARSARAILATAEWCHDPIGRNTDEALRRWRARGRSLLDGLEPAMWATGSAAGQDIAVAVWLSDSFYGVEKPPSEREVLLNAAIALATSGATAGSLMEARAQTRARRDDLVGAAQDLDQAIRLLAQAGDARNLAHAYRIRGGIRERQDQDTEALADFDHARALYEASSDGLGLAQVQQLRGYLFARRGDLAAGEVALTQCIEAFTRLHDRLGVANAHLARAQTRRAAGDRVGAVADLVEAEAHYAALGSRLGLGQVRWVRGDLLAMDGQLDAARRLLEVAVADSRAAEDGLGLASALARLAWVWSKIGDRAAARSTMEEAEPVARRAKNQGALDLLVQVRAWLEEPHEPS